LILQAQIYGQAVCLDGIRSIAQYTALDLRSLQEIAQQGTIISDLLEKLSRFPKPTNPIPQKQLPWESPNRSDKAKSYPVLLTPADIMPNPLFRETGIHFSGYVTNKEGSILSSSKGLELSLSVYRRESSPRLLRTNISGKQILRGTKTASVDVSGRFSFPHIVINEVSFHYQEEEFILVIAAKEDFVKPLMFKHVTVRARRKRIDSDSIPRPGISPEDGNNRPDS
jgi:hypothetical protein